MLTSTRDLLRQAQAGGYAVGAFNIYNLEGAAAVVEAAEELSSPVILQLLPSALQIGGRPLVAMCLEMARSASIPAVVHLDHCSSEGILSFALECGCSSVMADGSELKYERNIQFTRNIVAEAKKYGAAVEAELGKLSGVEDGITVAAREAQLTIPAQAAEFVHKTGVAALAICIGNIHGKYVRKPNLDFDRLGDIADRVEVPLVLHGTSGLPDEMITKCIELGICKFNVNTEIRSAYLAAMADSFTIASKVELIDIMQRSIEAMKEPVRQKLRLFRSSGKGGE